MKRKLFVLYLLLPLLLLSCEDKNPDVPKKDDNKIDVVSQFVYDSMSSLYYWNKEILNKKPTANDNVPEKYFHSILNVTDSKHGWSWITDNVDALRASFAGEGYEAGYSLSFTRVGNEIFAFVEYVYDQTPAFEAGIERLHFIRKVNGKAITADKDGYIDDVTINALYGDNEVSLSLYRLDGNTIEHHKDITIQPRKIKKNPVMFSSIFVEGDKTIGYLVYNSYISDYNTQLHEAFSTFKQAGVDELILDLRYNRGGDISAATYLASLIVKEKYVKDKSVFTMLQYNDEIGDNVYRLGINEKQSDYPNPLTANLNLDNIYIIATSGSYSASELTTFCLKQFADVRHIGTKTGGKYTASITVHAYDGEYGFTMYPSQFFPDKHMSQNSKSILANWAIQPIVAIYTDNTGEDFIAANGLIPDVKLEEGFGYISLWTPFGDTKDVLLGQALYEITGNEEYKPVMPEETRSSIFSSEKIKVKNISIADEIRKESVIIDSF